jgi:hypothetical protein
MYIYIYIWTPDIKNDINILEGTAIEEQLKNHIRDAYIRNFFLYDEI